MSINLQIYTDSEAVHAVHWMILTSGDFVTRKPTAPLPYTVSGSELTTNYESGAGPVLPSESPSNDGSDCLGIDPDQPASVFQCYPWFYDPVQWYVGSVQVGIGAIKAGSDEGPRFVGDVSLSLALANSPYSSGGGRTQTSLPQVGCPVAYYGHRGGFGAAGAGGFLFKANAWSPGPRNAEYPPIVHQTWAIPQLCTATVYAGRRFPGEEVVDSRPAWAPDPSTDGPDAFTWHGSSSQTPPGISKTGFLPQDLTFPGGWLVLDDATERNRHAQQAFLAGILAGLAASFVATRLDRLTRVRRDNGITK